MSKNNKSLFVYRPLLTQMTIRRGLGAAGIGTKIAPLVRHDAINGVYFKRDRYRIGHVKTERAPGERVKRSETTRGNLEPFMAVDHSIDKTVPRELVDGMSESALFGEMEQASYEALNEVQYDHELKVRNMLWADDQAGFNSIYGSDHVKTPGNKWDTADGEIYRDVQSLSDDILKTTGFRPNTAVIPKKVLDVLQGDPNNEIGERIKYTNGEIPDTTRLARYLRLDNVIVPESLEDDANPGQSNERYDWMWDGEHVGLFYVNPANTRNKVTLASTFYTDMPNEPFLGIFTRYDDDYKSYIVRCNAYFDAKEVDIKCGAVLYDVLTPPST